MARYLTGVLIAILAVGCQTPPQPTPSQSPNPVSVSAPVQIPSAPPAEGIGADLDFGQVRQGEVVTGTFEVHGGGEKPLKIGPPSSSSSCCLEVSLDGDLLHPDSGIEVTVSFDSTHQPGMFLGEVFIPVEGDDKPRVFTVKAGVSETIVPDPWNIFPDEQGRAVFRIKSDLFSSGLEIVRVEVSDPKVVVTPGERTPDHQEFRVDFSQADAKVGAIRLLTNHSDIEDVQVGYGLDS